jgi:uncharacterized protein YndB with AHSA1/START domain
MAKPFEVRTEVEVGATPEQAWEAITTGPEIDSWFLGRNEIKPGPGGTVRTAFPGFTMESTITTWEPPHRFVLDTGQAPDGRHMVFAYEIEGRAGGRTIIRLVHSGFLPDADWEMEFDALKQGDPMYIRKLAEYLTYFQGQYATPIEAYGPQVDRNRAWDVLKRELGISGEPKLGQRIHVDVDGIAPLDGEVDEVSRDTIGVRTRDGIYRFIHGLGGTISLGHHIFSKVDPAVTARAWQGWLDRAYA